MRELKSLHPTGPKVLPVAPDAPPLQRVDTDELAKIIGKMANGAAPGRSGWTGDLLRALIHDDECLQGLGYVIADIINGIHKGEARNALLGSILVAIPKSNKKARPIAMGEAFYKLAGLYVLKLIKKEMGECLGDHQYAMVPGGSERAAQSILAAISANPSWLLLSVDIENAFNSRNRSQILQEVYSNVKLQRIWNFVDWAYGQPSPLWIKDNGVIIETFPSSQGVRQGDPLASFLFALSMSKIYSDSQLDGAKLIAVQDDVFYMGPPESVIKSFHALRRLLEGTGLRIQVSKTAALADEKTQILLARDNIDVSNSFITGLGVCFSRDRDVISNWLVSSVKSVHKPLFDVLMTKKLSGQAAFQILRKCALPIMNYWSRAIPPTALWEAANVFDGLVLETARHIFKLGKLSDPVLKQMELPVRLGGLGLMRVTTVSPIAWTCSLGQTAGQLEKLGLVTADAKGWLQDELSHALKVVEGMEFKFKFPKDPTHFWTLFAIEPATKGLQRQVMRKVWARRRLEALGCFKPKTGDFARMVSLNNKYAGSWLNGSLGSRLFRMDDQHFGMAIKLRLGLPPATDVHKCECGASLVKDSSHFLSCAKLTGERTFRHNRLVGLLSQLARMSKVPTRLEPGVGGNRERADLEIAFSSCHTLVDVSVVHVQAPSISAKAVGYRAAAKWREQKKIRQYEDKARLEGKKFFPVVLESTGTLGEHAEVFFEVFDDETLVEDSAFAFGMSRMTFYIKAVVICNASIALRGIRISRGLVL